jgi:uncharacterized Zn finger protein (UPF0148 family)
MDILEVTCPDCRTVLVVDRKTGKVLEVKRPIGEASTGDRFEDARAKVLGTKARAESKFDEVKERSRRRLDELDKLFKDRKDELKDRPVEKPDSPFGPE